MTEWISLAVAVAALAYTVWASRHERSNRREELGLLREQVSSQLAEQDALLHAHLGARQRESRGGVPFDVYRFEVTNAGRAFARHVAGRVEDKDGDVVAGPFVAEDYGVQPGESTDVFVELPPAIRGSTGLHFAVGWVDSAGNEDWMRHHERRWRVATAVETLRSS